MSRTVLITGASRGIGAAIARRFAAEGWRVAVNYSRSQEQALALCAELGGGAIAIQGDVSQSDQAKTMVEKVISSFGQLDALVCNAGIALPNGLLQDCTDADWRRVFAVDVDGVFYSVRAALPYMVRQQGGRIITISSMWGQVGGSCEVPYSAAKGAVIAFTKALAQEVGPSHITANCIAPGVIQTEMLSSYSQETLDALAEEAPLGVLGQPEDIAAAACFLAGDGGKFVTGQVLGVNGGLVIT
jgi:3-oxoacyl-[acyl-carrier protein] reductase